MTRIPAWVGVLLIAFCIGASLVFSLFHVQSGEYIAIAFSLGLAIANGGAHAETQSKLESTKTELVTLRASMHPAREPSMHEIEIIPPQSETPKP